MSTSYGKKRFGLFENGDFSKMSNENYDEESELVSTQPFSGSDKSSDRWRYGR